MKLIFTVLSILTVIFSSGQKALHIYGGTGHDVYLGFLNCDNYNTNSIWNEYGTYGSNYCLKSIWNEYGTYGSDYSNESPFNAYASYPPVIVDKDGGFYGYFTVNQYRSKRADIKLVMTIYKFYELIRDDVSEWYEKIFE